MRKINKFQKSADDFLRVNLMWEHVRRCRIILTGKFEFFEIL